MKVTDELVEIGARAIAPYAWNDAFWRVPARLPQYDRNKLHCQAVARRDARECLEAVARALATPPSAGDGNG